MKLSELFEYDVYNKEHQLPGFVAQSRAFKKARNKDVQDTLSGWIVSVYKAGKMNLAKALQRIEIMRREGEITTEESDWANEQLYKIAEIKHKQSKEYH